MWNTNSIPWTILKIMWFNDPSTLLLSDFNLPSMYKMAVLIIHWHFVRQAPFTRSPIYSWKWKIIYPKWKETTIGDTPMFKTFHDYGRGRVFKKTVSWSTSIRSLSSTLMEDGPLGGSPTVPRPLSVSLAQLAPQNLSCGLFEGR